MTKKIVGVLLIFVSMLAVTVGVRAAEMNVSGTWTLGIEGDHVIPMAMVVMQDGAKISGTIAMPINHQGDRRDIPFEGEVTADGLSFSTTAGTPHLEFVGKPSDDGTLAGTVAVGEHTMNWTAERLKERKKG